MQKPNKLQIHAFSIDENYEQCPPRADAMIHSLRAFGYDLSMAIADLIDNSIFAGAENIWVRYDWNKGNPWISITDDGSGMTEKRLVEAMRLGTNSPLEERDPKDLGRFGLGLKTASFSQCKLLSVCTKRSSGETATRFWDLDYVQRSQSWLLGKVPPADAIRILDTIREQKKGTVVLWQNLDRIHDGSGIGSHDREKSFLGKFLSVKEYLEMVFHQYLSSKTKKISIKVGEGVCMPWDPYLKSNDFTQELSSEKYADKRVTVVPYVLPHVSKRSAKESEEGSGPKGWNAQQGFYVYRNKRMIVSGGYLDFDLKAEEHFKLARIKIDITNDMDHEWSIDVRKAVAIPPDRLRSELLRIAKVTRQKASEVYRARTGAVRKGGTARHSNDIWLKRKSGEKIAYRLNRDNQVIKRILDEVSPKKSWVNKLFHVIESTVPHKLIIMDDREHEDCHVNLPENLNPPPDEMMSMCLDLYREHRAGGMAHDEVVELLCGMDIFCTHPAYRAYLDDCAAEEA